MDDSTRSAEILFNAGTGRRFFHRAGAISVEGPPGHMRGVAAWQPFGGYR